MNVTANPPANPPTSIYLAQSMEEVRQLYRNASESAFLLGPPEERRLTEMVIADAIKAVNLKTQLSIACGGNGGFLGTIAVTPRLDPGQSCFVHWFRADWTVTQYQAHWFEWRGGRPEYRHSQVRFAGEGKYWQRIRLRWEAGLPAHDDYDYLVEENVWKDAKA